MNKRLISILLSFSFIIAGFPATVFASDSTYLALGDSISAGYGLDSPEDSFPVILSNDTGYTLTNLAENGYTIQDVLTLLESGEADSVISDAQLITITCGGNDIIGVLLRKVAAAYNEAAETPISENDVLPILSNAEDSRRTVLMLRAFAVISGNKETPAFTESPELYDALENYKNDLAATISYIKSINPEVRIIVATQYNPYRTFNYTLSALGAQGDKGVSLLNGIIQENADILGYEVADIYTLFATSQINPVNASEKTGNLDFHPNAFGHTIIAECIGAMVDKFDIFSDVKPDDWFCDAVRYVYENKLFMGVSQTEFAPNTPLTRGMFVTVLYRAEGSPETVGETSFSDVSADAYYRDAVLWATQNGIVSGYSENIFAPDDYITREQISTIILRYAEAKGKGPVGAWAIRLDYSDLDELSDYAGSGVMFSTMKGIMTGKDGSRFAPKDCTTRAEAAVIMKNLAEIL